jgi:hypothetical protein
MINARPAPLPFVLAVKRRLETTTPGARLDEESVRLIAIPKTQFDAVVFLFEHNKQFRLIAELARPDLPHVYAGKTVDPKSRASMGTALLWVITQLGYRILTDRRFSRGNIVQINGFAHP